MILPLFRIVLSIIIRSLEISKIRKSLEQFLLILEKKEIKKPLNRIVDDAAAFPRTDVRSARRGKTDETVDDAAAFPRTDVRSARRGKSDETVDETIGWDDAIWTNLLSFDARIWSRCHFLLDGRLDESSHPHHSSWRMRQRRVDLTI